MEERSLGILSCYIELHKHMRQPAIQITNLSVWSWMFPNQKILLQLDRIRQLLAVIGTSSGCAHFVNILVLHVNRC